MLVANNFALIDKFPRFDTPGFDIEAYNDTFRQSNVIINASSSDVSYTEHWGCLSVKCAFGGTEMYKISDRYYAVTDDAYFICNEGQYYSSFIAARKPVESFTINFTDAFVKQVKSSLYPDAKLLDDPGFIAGASCEFVEKLYRHSGGLNNSIARLRMLAKNFGENRGEVSESYFPLLQNMLLSQGHILNEIKQVKAVKLSTQKELYKRLHHAKDYIESCFAGDVPLEKLAQISCLNSAYLLRNFKQYFGQTPYQYLINKRMAVAAQLLVNTAMPVSEICFETGYADVSSFCRLFKKTYSCSPENYRASKAKKVIFST
ncbi:MAG: AraC family transcriptional regulator [Mucilaginibacter sp.]